MRDDTAVALQPRLPPLWTATDALARVARLLDVLPDGSQLTDFLPRIPDDAPARAVRRRAALASTLIAGLELARDGRLALEQVGDWMPIQVKRRQTDDPIAGEGTPPAGPVPPA